MFGSDPVHPSPKDWLTREQRGALRPAGPVIAAGLLTTLLGIGQALAAAAVLTGHATGLALAAFLLCAVGHAAAMHSGERAAFATGAAARRRLRADILARLFAARPALGRTFHSAELTEIAVDRIEALDGFFGRYIPAAVLTLTAPVLVWLAVLWLDPHGALIAGLCGLLVPAGMALAGLGAQAAARRQFLAMTRLKTRFLDRIRGIATIVTLGRADDEAMALTVAADELRVRTMRVLRVAFLSSTVLDLALALAIVLLAIRYATAWQAGTMGPAFAPLAVLLLVPEFFAPMRAFALAYQDRFQAEAAAEALADVPPLPAPPPPRDVRTVETLGISVAFDDVWFTWDASRGPALKGLSFRVPAGESLVLAGPSGAGKSTAMEILLGFARPEKGRVTINGRDIADLTPSTLAGVTAWIGQRPVLFAGAIRDNILFGRPGATGDELMTAVRAARVDAFVDTLPEGLDTVVGEGGYGLSGGQVQRIAIARAFLKNAPLLLLDEPTAHLDPTSEQEVLDGLRRLAAGRTVILAGHSMATRAFAGRRLEIRDGRAEAARGVA